MFPNAPPTAWRARDDAWVQETKIHQKLAQLKIHQKSDSDIGKTPGIILLITL